MVIEFQYDYQEFLDYLFLQAQINPSNYLFYYEFVLDIERNDIWRVTLESR